VLQKVDEGSANGAITAPEMGVLLDELERQLKNGEFLKDGSLFFSALSRERLMHVELQRMEVDRIRMRHGDWKSICKT
jgi:hypothetical protein